MTPQEIKHKKPPLLSDEDLYRQVFCNIKQLKPGDSLVPLGRKVAQCQRKADIKWYGANQ